MGLHELERIGKRALGADRHRVDHHPGFELLDVAHLVGLGLGLEIAMDHAEAAGLGHGNRQGRVRHRVHRRRQQRDAELDLRGDAGTGVDLAGQDGRGGGNQRDVVEGQGLRDFHGVSYTKGAAPSIASAPAGEARRRARQGRRSAAASAWKSPGRLHLTPSNMRQ